MHFGILFSFCDKEQATDIIIIFRASTCWWSITQLYGLVSYDPYAMQSYVSLYVPLISL